MEKSFEPRFVKVGEYKELKKLWKTSFDDSDRALDAFFEKTVTSGSAIAIFDAEKAVSALYMLESEIIISGVSYRAFYIYAVCTHPDYRGRGLMNKLFGLLKSTAVKRNINYLFLVPREDYLFGLYGKQGFLKGFCYKEKTVFKSAFENICVPETYQADFESYKKYSFEKSYFCPVAMLKEKPFNSFFFSAEGTVTALFTDNGYILYEYEHGRVTVFEYFGDEASLLRAVFVETDAEWVEVREPCSQNEEGIPYGMYCPVSDAPEIENGFFGIPYST